jgi:uncharacterized protein (TIGR04255 family)
MDEQKYPHLNRAPIVEALIDIQCIWGAGLPHEQALGRLREKAEGLKEEYPTVQPQIAQQFKINVGAGASFTPVVAGFLLRHKSAPYALQLRRNGFTFSRLAPYDTWNDLRLNAEQFWQHYIKDLGEVSLTRLAARYINRVQIPYPLTGDSSWLPGIRQPLTKPSELSQVLSFMDQTVSLDAPSSATVGLLRAVQQAPPGTTTVDVVVDIEVFRQVTNLDGNSEQIWKIIDVFHNVKNRVFFEAVGPAIIDKYK